MWVRSPPDPHIQFFEATAISVLTGPVPVFGYISHPQDSNLSQTGFDSRMRAYYARSRLKKQSAQRRLFFEATARIELAHSGFADRRITTFLRGRTDHLRGYW